MTRLSRSELGRLLRKVPNKYHNVKCEWQGERFDSIKERDRWIILQEEQKKGLIRELKRQVVFELVPDQKIDGKLIERKIQYIADFTYKYRNSDELIVEDAKGIRTKEYRIKRKLMLWVWNVQIREV